MSATFAALGNRTYRLYFTGGAVSNVGSWVQRVAQDWLVLEIGGGAAGLGITTGLQFLPFLLLSPVGGIIADRFPKKRILQTTQVTMGLLAATLGVLTVTGAVTVWEVYVLAFLFGVAGALDAPARQSFVAEMVGKDHLANAIGLNSASFNAARLVGPGLAGLLIVSLGTGLTIVLNAVTYAGTFMALQLMREDQLNTPAKVERTKGMFGDGLRYLRQRPQLLLVLAIAGIVGAFGLNFQMTSALMATEVFGKGAGAYGVLGSILAIGSLAGALMAARRGMPRGRLIVMSALAFGVVELLAGLMPTYLTYALMLPLLGFTSLTLLTAANATMQLTVAPEMRGRVMAVYLMVFQGSTPIGSPIIGWIGQEFGARWTLLVGGGISFVGVLVATLLLAHARGLVLRAHVLPRPHLHVFSEPGYVTRRAELATPAARVANGSIRRLLTGGDRYLAAARRGVPIRPFANRPLAARAGSGSPSRPPNRPGERSGARRVTA